MGWDGGLWEGGLTSWLGRGRCTGAQWLVGGGTWQLADHVHLITEWDPQVPGRIQCDLK